MFARIVSTVAVVLIFGGYSDSKEEAAGGGAMSLANSYQLVEQGRFQAMLIEGRNAIKITPSVSEAP